MDKQIFTYDVEVAMLLKHATGEINLSTSFETVIEEDYALEPKERMEQVHGILISEGRTEFDLMCHIFPDYDLTLTCILITGHCYDRHPIWQKED